jgi:serine/threonine protein kinase
VGTPLYLSPEVLAGEPPTPALDVWSLTVVLYQALAGTHPFAGHGVAEVMRRIPTVPFPDLRDTRPECPALLAAFFNDALSLVPARRPATADALRSRLQWLRAHVTSNR